MKKKFFILAGFFSIFGFSQKTPLQKQLGIEATFTGVAVSYELPLSNNILTDISAGVANGTVTGNSSFTYSYFDFFKPFTRVEVKRYYNRDNRVQKGKDINNNRGNFIGIQNKIYYGGVTTETMMINEIHWGTQTELAKKLLFTFQIGAGHYMNYDKDYMFFPTMGLKVKYVF